MKLEYKTLYGDLLIFKNLNDCMTISNANNWSTIDIDSIEANGVKLELEDCEYDFFKHSDNPFTKEEMEEGLAFYQELLDNNYL